MLEKDSYVPYYLQIYSQLKSRIDSMMYKPDEMLPSENELVEEFNVTRVTIRNALRKLKDEAVIRTEKGKGSFVNHPKMIQRLDSMYSIARDFGKYGQKLVSERMEIFKEKASDAVKELLQLKDNDEVIVVNIVRGLEDTPIVSQLSYLPVKIVPELAMSELQTSTIYEVLETKYGIKLVNAKEYLDPIAADVHLSDILKVEVGTPLFKTERITYTEYEKPVEYRRCVIRSDKFRFSVELKK